MKKLISFIFLIIFINNYHSQTVFWTETFGTGCSQGQLANGAAPTSTNGAWVVNSTGTNDPYANEWYISATAAGMGAGNCGNGCLNNAGLTNRTLHVGNITISLLGYAADQGAAYAEGGCGFGFCTSTNKRAESPTINCTGYSNITLSFEYIQQGTPGSDYTELMYFDGTTWNSLGNLPVTPTCPPTGTVSQAIWTNYSVVLPSSANNNPNVKIGFRWQNIDDGVATDPSFAVDNIKLSAPASSLSPTISVSSNTVCSNAVVTATATNTGTSSVTGYTWSSSPSNATLTPTNSSVTTINFPPVSSPTTYSINVLVTNGTNTASAVSIFTVYPNPTITISATSNTMCAGSNVTLTASGANSYTWSPSSSLSAANGPTVIASPTSNTTYTVVGSNSNGCNNTATITVTVLPSPTINVSASSNTLCANGNVTLTANGASNYTWSPSSSLSSSNGSMVIASPTVNTTYTVYGSLGGNCPGSNTITISVTSSPTITISSTGNTICPNGNTTLTANGANNYTWAPPSSLSSSTGSAVVASPTINTTYTVSGSNAFGCISTATINVVIGPPFTITVTPSSATTCVGGSSVSITAMGNGAYGSINYNWAPSTGLNVTTGPLVSASPSTTTTYTVIGSAGSCTAMATTTVNVTPPPPFTVTPTNTVLCQGSSITYTATGLSSYTWSPAFTLSSNTGSIVTANPTVTTTYTVTGRDNNGCLANPQIITLTVVPVPTATAVLTTPLGNDSICGNTTGTLSVNTSTPPTGFAYNYTWTAPPSYTNTFIVPPNFQQVAIVPPVPNPTAVIVYSVQVAYSTLSTCISAPSTVTVYVINCNPPVASFTTIPGNDTLCTGECIVLMNTSTGGQPQTIQWQVPGAIPNTATGDFPQFCFPVPGNYTVFIKVTNNWGKDSTIAPNYIHVVDTPNVIGIRDTSINFGDCVTLYGTQASYYSWSGPNGLICNPCTSITPCVYETTNYFVTGYNSKRCKNTDTVTVRIKSDCGEMFIPSAFSPNGDGKNDILYVRGRCLKNFTLQIFNRWGELVFETSDKNIGWDGTQNGEPLNTGVFVYKLEGTTYDNKQYIQKGNITLLR